MNSDIFNKEIGRRIKEIREIRRITQDELAVAVMISQSSIARLEKGQCMVSVYTMVEIAKTLEVPLTDLLATSGEFHVRELEKLAEKLKEFPQEERRKLISLFEEFTEFSISNISRTKTL